MLRPFWTRSTQRDSQGYCIRKKVGEIVKRYLGGNRFIRKNDILRIIHLTDTDGAFIPNKAVQEDLLEAKTRYSTEAIFTPHKKSIEDRNLQKKSCLRELVKTKAIMNIPYQIFFMSCNLEHVLHNQMNCSQDEKEQLAFQFANRYKNDAEGFRMLMEKSDFSVVGTYQDSWRLIERETESLKRHSNLCLAWKEE